MEKPFVDCSISVIVLDILPQFFQRKKKKFIDSHQTEGHLRRKIPTIWYTGAGPNHITYLKINTHQLLITTGNRQLYMDCHQVFRNPTFLLHCPLPTPQSLPIVLHLSERFLW